MYPAIHTYKNYNKMQLIKCKSLVPNLNSMRMLQLQDIFSFRRLHPKTIVAAAAARRDKNVCARHPSNQNSAPARFHLTPIVDEECLLITRCHPPGQQPSNLPKGTHTPSLCSAFHKSTASVSPANGPRRDEDRKISMLCNSLQNPVRGREREPREEFRAENVSEPHRYSN